VKLLFLDQVALAPRREEESQRVPIKILQIYCNSQNRKRLCKPFKMGHKDKHTGILYDWILPPGPAAMAGKEDVEAEVEASAAGSRFGLSNGSEGGGQPADGGCWMVWRECPPSIEGRLCGPSKSYSSLTIRAELGPELVSVSPDRSVDQREQEGELVPDNANL